MVAAKLKEKKLTFSINYIIFESSLSGELYNRIKYITIYQVVDVYQNSGGICSTVVNVTYFIKNKNPIPLLIMFLPKIII